MPKKSINKKSIKKNYIYNMIYQVLLLLTPLITTPYLSRILGPDGIGTVSFAESIVAYFTLFAALGTATFGQREISYVQDDREKLTAVFWETKILQIIISSIVLAVYLIFALIQKNSSLYLILSFNILAITVDVVWLIQGMEEFEKIALKNIFFKGISIAYIFAVVKTKDDILKYVFGSAFFLLISNISMWIHVPQYVDRPNLKLIKPFRNIKGAISLFIPTAAVYIYTVLDKTMIGVITESGFENGYYEQAVKISKMVMTVVTSLGTVMIPRIGYHFGRGETEKVQFYLYRSYRFVWFLGVPLCFGLIGTASNFVPWFFGEGYEKVIPLLGILSFLIIDIGINNVTGLQFFVPTKRQNLLTVTVMTGAAVNFLSNIFLIRMLQSTGAAIASVMAETVVTVLQIYLVRKELSFRRIIASGRNYLIAGGAMLLSLVFVGNRLIPSIVHTFMLVIMGAVVYFAMLFMLRDDFFLENMHGILIKMKERRQMIKLGKSGEGLISLREPYKNKIEKLTEYMYYLAAAMYFSFMIIYSSMFMIFLTPKVNVLILAGILGILMLREGIRFLCLKKYDLREYIGFSICLLFWYIAEKNDSSIQMCMFMLIFAGRSIDLHRTFKLVAAITTVLIIAAFWASGEGYILNYNYPEDGIWRHSFGFCYPLIIPCYILNIAMMLAVMRNEKVSFTEIALVFLFGVTFYRWCKAELSGAVTIVVALVMLLIKICPKILTTDFILWKVIDRIAVVIYPICLFISLWFTFNYDNSVKWMQELDFKTGGRLGFQYDGFLKYGFKVWGQRMYFVGAGVNAFGEKSEGAYDYVDNIYIQLLIRYGIVFSVISIVLITLAMIYCYQKKMRLWLWMLSLWALHGLFEDKMHLAYFNSLLLIIGPAFQNVNLTVFNHRKAFQKAGRKTSDSK